MADLSLPDEAMSALSFPRQGFPSVYLHSERVRDAFTGNLGAIAGFVRSAENAGLFSGEVGILWAKLGGQKGKQTGSSIQFDLREDVLAQALVLRTYLADNKEPKGSQAGADHVLHPRARAGGYYIETARKRPCRG
jgi:hypothetical protein